MVKIYTFTNNELVLSDETDNNKIAHYPRVDDIKISPEDKQAYEDFINNSVEKIKKERLIAIYNEQDVLYNKLIKNKYKHNEDVQFQTIYENALSVLIKEENAINLELKESSKNE